MKKRKWIKRLALALVLVGVVAAVAMTLRGAEAAPVDEALIIKVKRADLAVEVIDTGKIEPREKVDIKSKVAGVVLEVLVDEGQVVKKGQTLLRLDPMDYARDAARVDAELAQAQQALAFAEQALARKKAALAQRAVAEADVEAAQNEVDMRKAAIRIADVAVSAARDRLRSCEIRSPLDGTVIERGIEPGEVVSPGVQATFEGKPLLTVADLSTLLVRTELNQIDVARVVLEQSVKVTLDALPDRNWEATVTKIAPAAVKAQGRDAEVFPVEATLRAADAAIKSGMTADVRILVETRPQVLTLPIEAVLKEEGKSWAKKVARVDNGTKKAEKVELQVGRSNDREREILAGLQEGDEVAIDPVSAKDNEAKL
ncbi:MAG: efflux RND transporter periplasmic adaptor subunit [Deltaproteobacteria bacterium]|nr:efflux RND transporter periplasmic adaptor subunit [Deltaproteobacteria bacterium]